MTTFVDTSALLAFLDPDDSQHDIATRWLETVAAEADEHLLTHSYVVTETIALVHRRMGMPAVRALIDDLLPVCETRYVDASLHTKATSAFLAGTGRRPSFVDRVSFELMREEHIAEAFAFDRDFTGQGFRTVP